MTQICGKYLHKGPRVGVEEGEGELEVDTILKILLIYRRACRNWVIISLLLALLMLGKLDMCWNMGFWH